MTPECEDEIKQWHIKKFGTAETNINRTVWKLMEEVGELGMALRKNDVPNIGEECADIVIVLTNLCRGYGLSISKEVDKKIDVLFDRLANGKK